MTQAIVSQARVTEKHFPGPPAASLLSVGLGMASTWSGGWRWTQWALHCPVIAPTPSTPMFVPAGTVVAGIADSLLSVCWGPAGRLAAYPPPPPGLP